MTLAYLYWTAQDERENFNDIKKFLNERLKACYLKAVEWSVLTTITDTAKVYGHRVPGSGCDQGFIRVIAPHPHPLQDHWPHFTDEGTEAQQY